MNSALTQKRPGPRPRDRGHLGHDETRAATADNDRSAAEAGHEPGDEARFVAVAEEFGPALVRLSAGYERDPAQREELVQEIWLQLWRALPGFRGDASLRTFVFRVAHNTAVRHVHRATHRPSKSADPAPETLAASDDDPESTYAQRHALAALHARIAALPPPDREIVILHLEGVPQREIAEITSLSPSNVSSRLHRVRQRLREERRSS